MAERGVIVVGAGAAGLAVAAMVQRHGVPALVLERSKIGASWLQRYDRLRLNTTRLFSSLPGHVIQRANGRWVHRDDFVHYLERYADLHGLNVRCGIAVRRIDRHVEGGWLLSTSAGPV